jgi:hypothetical protein
LSEWRVEDYVPVVCEKCWPLEDAIKAQSPKSYERGPVNLREHTVPPYPMTDEQRAILMPPAPEQPKEAKKQPVTYTGHEVPVESLVKRTKTGAINTQSTLGKVVAAALDAGCEVRAWESEAANGIAGAHHGLRFTVVGANVMMNGRIVPKDELLERLNQIEKED